MAGRNNPIEGPSWVYLLIWSIAIRKTTNQCLALGGVVMNNLVVEYVGSLLIAVVASWVTVKFSLGRFFTEKWWERKEQAYSDIIGSLAKLRIYFARWEKEKIEHKIMSAEELKKLNKEYQLAKEVIENAVVVGSFVISEEAADRLATFLKDLEQETIRGDLLEDIERHYGQADECIGTLREIAKKDLRKR